MRAQALLAVLALALAGCLAPEAAPGPSPDPGAVIEQTRFLTSDMGLAPAPGAAGAVRSGSFFQAWAAGDDYPTWAAEPVAANRLLDNITAKLYLRATGPVVESVRFPDIMIYGGSGGAFMSVATAKFSSVMAPGDVHEVDLTLSAPLGGLVVPAGEPLAFKVVPVMHQNDAADIEVLVGGDTASRVAWQERALRLPIVTLAAGSAEGEATGSAYAGAAAPDSIHHRTVVHANETPRAFLVWMNTTEHQGIPDIDLALVGPDGEEIASSGTPTPREMLRLSAPNLREAGDYTIVVTSYGSARASFTVEWLLG